MKNKVVRGVLGVALAWACACAFAQDATLNRARQLVDAKQFKEAFALLEPLEQTRAGEPDYDYLLGIAAIDSGQLTRGVFALERVLAVNPAHPQARAEIARAYFLMGENRLARSEFQSVKNARPPAEVDSAVDRFLSALDARDRSRHTGVTGYVELGLGHDTNVNAATGSASFAIPVFGGAVFALAPGTNQQDDEYWTLGAGLSGRLGVTDSIGIVGSASFEQKRNFDYEQFDTGSLSVSGGLSYRQGASEWIAALQAQRFDVENNRFRDAQGGVVQYFNNFTPNDRLSAYMQVTNLRYPGQTPRDANRYVFGGAWTHVYAGRTGSPVTYAGAYLGKEDAVGNFPHFAHDVYGVRGGGQIGLSDQWTLTAGANYEERRYQGPDPLFLTARNDKELQLRLAAIYQLDKNWSVTPALSFTNVKSNIIVNDYDRAMLSITGRYDFR
ncbi:MAG TPA: TonB-dependent receptor [Burkholderiales bacterium]|nr:TonB-dependent receptor [Burkholderiales bacterium]